GVKPELSSKVPDCVPPHHGRSNTKSKGDQLGNQGRRVARRPVKDEGEKDREALESQPDACRYGHGNRLPLLAMRREKKERVEPGEPTGHQERPRDYPHDGVTITRLQKLTT